MLHFSAIYTPWNIIYASIAQKQSIYHITIKKHYSHEKNSKRGFLKHRALNLFYLPSLQLNLKGLEKLALVEIFYETLFPICECVDKSRLIKLKNQNIRVDNYKAVTRAPSTP